MADQSACPVCNHATCTLKERISSEEASRHFVAPTADKIRQLQLKSHIEKLWGSCECGILKCPCCGFEFSDPYVAGDAQFYEMAYQRTHYPRQKFEFVETVSALSQISGNHAGSRLIELGAGDGAFLSLIADRLISKSGILATEYSDYGRSAIQGLGIETAPLDVKALAEQRPDLHHSFDYACLFQVLEHLDCLDGFMHALGCLLKDSAHIFLSVPNPEEAQFFCNVGALKYMPPNHIGLWSESAFQYFGRRHGWKIQSYKLEPSHMPRLYFKTAKYCYLRSTQNPGLFSGPVVSIKNRKLRLIFEALMVIAHGTRLMTRIREMSSPKLGASQWVHYVR